MIMRRRKRRRIDWRRVFLELSSDLTLDTQHQYTKIREKDLCKCIVNDTGSSKWSIKPEKLRGLSVSLCYDSASYLVGPGEGIFTQSVME